MSVSLTPNQQAAIDHRGSSLLLAASAGSGKTEVLARRCAALVSDCSRSCGVDQLLVVTFTRAAAAELRVRVARFLREKAAETPDPELRRHLRRQEPLIEAADIGTIDAWCGRLLREHYAEAKIDPAFVILGNENAGLLRREVLEELFQTVYTSDEPMAIAARAWLRSAVRPRDEFLREMVLRLNTYREHLLDPDAWFAQRAAEGEGDETALQARAADVLAPGLADDCAFLSQQLQLIVPRFKDDQAKAIFVELGDTLDGWRNRLNDVSAFREVVGQLAATSYRKPRGGAGADGELFKLVNERWFKKGIQKRWNADTIEPIFASASRAAELTRTLLTLEAEYDVRLRKAKAERGAYEFADALRLTLNLLGTPDGSGELQPTAVAERLRTRYEHVLVDEYQDTSALQVALLRLVSRDAAGETNRFMVGDVKQSIYGFREAEPDLFIRQVNAFDEHGEEGRVLPLTDNFRSHGRLLDGINRVFASLFAPELGGTTYGERETLVAGRSEIANPTFDGQPRISVHVLPKSRGGNSDGDESDDGSDDASLAERIECEGVLIAREIRTLLEAGAQVPERAADGSVELRPLRLSDIVILLRSARGNAPLLGQVLRNEGIACVAAGRDSLLDSLEVNDVRNALSLAVNRRQDLPLAAFLRGPFVELNEPQLHEIRQAAPHPANLVDAVEAYAANGNDESETSRKVRDTIATLNRWAIAAREMELPALLREVLNERSLTLFARGRPGGEHRAAMLRAIESLAVEFADNTGGGASEFVEFLDALVESDIRPSATAAVGEEAVRILTIHASKGLEFPIVFLAGAGAAMDQRGRDSGLLCDAQTGIGFTYFDASDRTDVTLPATPLLRSRLRVRERSEELRLLYVAATRARERLFVTGYGDPAFYERQRDACAGGPTPLMDRLTAKSVLEWFLIGTAASSAAEASGEEPPLIAVRDEEEVAPAERNHTSRSELPPESDADRQWIDLAAKRLATPLDLRRAEQPAVLSVSVLKQRAAHVRDAEPTRTLDRPPTLGDPRFAREAAAADGRVLGDACHRFLEHVDLRQLVNGESLSTERDRLLREGRLSPEEAALVPLDDIAWFADSPLGQLLAERAAECRREVPFVFALPIADGDDRPIIRGVIDCLLLGERLTILDYKTDRPRSPADMQRRVAGYSVQARLYALAAAKLFGRPVERVALIFLSQREVVEVDTDGFDPAALFAAMDEQASAPI